MSSKLRQQLADERAATDGLMRDIREASKHLDDQHCLEPPDGGSLSFPEQVANMRQELEELRARTQSEKPVAWVRVPEGEQDSPLYSGYRFFGIHKLPAGDHSLFTHQPDRDLLETLDYLMGQVDPVCWPNRRMAREAHQRIQKMLKESNHA